MASYCSLIGKQIFSFYLLSKNYIQKKSFKSNLEGDIKIIIFFYKVIRSKYEQSHYIFNNTLPSFAFEIDNYKAYQTFFTGISLNVLVFSSFFSNWLYWLLIFCLVSSLVCAHQSQTKNPPTVTEYKTQGLSKWKGFF